MDGATRTLLNTLPSLLVALVQFLWHRGPPRPIVKELAQRLEEAEM